MDDAEDHCDDSTVFDITCPACGKSLQTAGKLKRIKQSLAAHRRFCFAIRFSQEKAKLDDPQSQGLFDEAEGIFVSPESDDNNDTSEQTANSPVLHQEKNFDIESEVLPSPWKRRRLLCGSNRLSSQLDPGEKRVDIHMDEEDKSVSSVEDQDLEEILDSYDVHEYLLFDVQERTQRVCEEAEQLSKTLDEMFCRQHENSTCHEAPMHEAWDKMLYDYNVSVSFRKRLVQWIDKNCALSDGTSVRERIQRSRQATEGQVPTIPAETIRIKFGVGLVDEGFEARLHFKEPLLVLARTVTQILHDYDREAFDVGIKPDRSCAQDGEFLRGVKRHFPDHSLLVPFRVHIDGAHMRKNGLHSITPVMISVVHRHMYQKGGTFLLPEMVSVVPDIAPIIMDKLVPSSKIPQLNVALHHAVLKNLFASLPIVWKQHSFFIWHKMERIQCFPVLFKLCVDMPMAALCSFVKTSRPETQLHPCQQCLTKGKQASFFLHPACTGSSPQAEDNTTQTANDQLHNAGATRYRSEAAALRYCKESKSLIEKRERYNLRYIGKPVFGGMNPFDARGVFLLVAADGLHAFKSLWFRGLVTVLINLLYMYSQTPEQRRSKEGLMGNPDVVSRAGAILKTARGRAIVKIAEHLLTESKSRKGDDQLDIRRRNPFDQATLLQEHKYSFGMLLQVMAAVGCNVSERLLGEEWRRIWLHLACKCVSVYALLYQIIPTEESLKKAEANIGELLYAVHEMKEKTEYTWNAPKLHLLTHFPDMIREFGRMRMFDTVDGESAIKEVKKSYAKLCQREVFSEPWGKLLQKSEAAQANKITLIVYNQTKVLHEKDEFTPIRAFLRNSKTKNAKSIKLTYSNGRVVDGSNELESFVVKAIGKYITKRSGLGADHCDLVMQYRERAVSYVTNASGVHRQNIVARSASKHSKNRNDFVEYQRRNGQARFGMVMLFAVLTAQSAVRSENKCLEIAFLRPAGPCVLDGCPHQDLETVYMHACVEKIKHGKLKKLVAVNVSDLRRRVTAFIDPHTEKEHQNGTEGIFEWYFLLRPSVFENVEQYV